MNANEGNHSEIRVLGADDSAAMRIALWRMLESSPMVRVCGTAKNGLETVEKTKLLRPDVVTLDVQMPVMDGIQALKRIMSECPCPVIMVSCLTDERAEVTVEPSEGNAGNPECRRHYCRPRRSKLRGLWDAPHLCRERESKPLRHPAISRVCAPWRSELPRSTAWREIRPAPCRTLRRVPNVGTQRRKSA